MSYVDSIAVQDDGCWLWTGGRQSQGYGKFDGERLAHRVVYELLVGPIPDGLELDHVCHGKDQSCGGGPACRHRRCVNPAPLEPVTHAENVRRGRSAAGLATSTGRCLRGHVFTDANTYVVPATGARHCRTCRNERQRVWRSSR